MYSRIEMALLVYPTLGTSMLVAVWGLYVSHRHALYLQGASQLEVSLTYSDLVSALPVPPPAELPKLILSFDNMQYLPTKQQSSDEVTNETPVSQNSVIYIWGALCDVVARACERYPELRIVFSMNKNAVAHHIPLSDPVKLAEIAPLSLPSEENIEDLLHYYLDGWKADDYDLKWVAMQLVGPPQILQQFLSHVGALQQLEEGQVRAEVMKKAIEKVRDTHQRDLVATFNLLHERSKPVLEAVCEVWSSVRKLLQKNERAKLNRAKVTRTLTLPKGLPDSWREVEGCGLLQSCPGAGGRVLEVYPFLIHLLNRLQVPKCYY